MTDTKRRFEIFVPSPKARINLGKRNDSSTGDFGYDGVSIQSDVHLFIDANKNTLFQTGKDYCGQVGGKWVQYSNADMVMSATASMGLSADKKIVLATGAGQGQITALDHGSTPSAIPYNNLGLHYEVESLDVSLFEFFHGRRERNKRGALALAAMKLGGIIDSDTDDGAFFFDASKKATTKEGDGFASMATASLRELFPVKTERDLAKFDKKVDEPGDPIEMIDDLVNTGLFGKKDDPTAMKFGFSGYVKRFDPYALADESKAKNMLGRGLIKLMNAMKHINRFIDVTEKYASLLSDNFLMKRVQAAQGAFDGFASAFSNTYGLAKLGVGSFDDPKPFGGIVAKFGDEYASGLGARAQLAATGPGAAEAYQAGAGKIAKKRAAINSTVGPWDLSGAAGTIKVEWGDKAASPTTQRVIDLGAPTPAVMAIKSKAELPRLMVTVLVDNNHLPTGVTFADIKTKLAKVLGVTEPELDDANTIGGALIQPEPKILAKILFERADLDAEILRDEVPAVPGTPSQPGTPSFPGGPSTPGTPGQPGTPAVPAVTMANVGLSVSHHSAELRVAVSGTWQTVTVTTANLSSTYRMGKALQSALSGLSGASASAYDPSDQSFTLTTSATGTGASIEIGASEGWVLKSLGKKQGSAEYGQAPLDLTAVTAEQLFGRITASKGLSKSLSSGSFTLKGPYLDDKDPRSWVKVSGAKVAIVFGADPTENQVSAYQSSVFNEGLAGFDASMAALNSWSHELSKVPEDMRNMTRPLRQATSMLVGAIGGVESAVQKAVEVIGSPATGLPDSSSNKYIGLIGNGGITLGSTDRIVGVGGKGVLFVCDGGSGSENHKKFVAAGPVKIEDFVNQAMQFDPIDMLLKKLYKKETPAADAKADFGPSLGFRVVSDSTVDLMGTRAAQLMALGRAKLNADFSDGSDKDDAGIGVVRVAASHAAEVAGFRKVVISARNPGTDDKTGGRVELAGQTIAIGGMNLDDTADTQDFADVTDRPRFGLEPIDVDVFAGAENLSDDQKTALNDDFARYAWSKTLHHDADDHHPNTERVFMHAVKETIIQVGTYVVQVRSADQSLPGIQIGTRKPNPDPTINEIDEDKPRLELDDSQVAVYANKDTKTFWDADGIGLYHKDSGANVVLEDTTVTVGASSSDTIVVKSGETKVTSAKVNLTGSSAIEIKAGSIKIG